jgi:hypothetical protein
MLAQAKNTGNYATWQDFKKHIDNTNGLQVAISRNAGVTLIVKLVEECTRFETDVVKSTQALLPEKLTIRSGWVVAYTVDNNRYYWVYFYADPDGEVYYWLYQFWML